MYMYDNLPIIVRRAVDPGIVCFEAPKGGRGPEIGCLIFRRCGRWKDFSIIHGTLAVSARPTARSMKNIGRS